MSASSSSESTCRPATPATFAPAACPLVLLDSGQLMQGRNEVLIRHGDEIYRLRHTRNDKLILTK